MRCPHSKVDLELRTSTQYIRCCRKLPASRLLLSLIALFQLAAAEPALGDVTQDIDSLIDKSRASSGEGNYLDAESYMRQALSYSVDKLGSMASPTGKLARMLADFYMERGRFADAETYLQRALVISSGYTGSTAQSDGAFLDTKHFINDSLANPTRLPGNIEVANTLSALANLFSKQQRYPESERLLKRVVQIYDSSGSNPGNLLNYTENASQILADSQRSLAQVQYKQGRTIEAEQSFKDYIATVRKSKGSAGSLAEALAHLSAFYKSQNRSSDADSVEQEIRDLPK